MTTVIEFLGHEHIENVVTSLNYKTDRIYYFGYQDEIDYLEESTRAFLKKYCKIKSENIYFVSIERGDYVYAINTMEPVIQKEKQAGHNVFFDITGGDSLMLVVFGYLSKDMDSPMHYYDIESGELIELNEGSSYNISTHAKEKKINLTVEKYIRLKRGIINHTLDDKDMDTSDRGVVSDVTKVWMVCKKYNNHNRWNKFSEVIRNHGNNDMEVSIPIKEAQKLLERYDEKFDYARMTAIVNDLADRNLVIVKKGFLEGIFFEYKNIVVKKAIRKSGIPLEFNTYEREKSTATDCLTSVVLDWDGEIRGLVDGKKQPEEIDNEIDVLSMYNYVPKFISCKGRAGLKEDLYELKAVTDRFGGKYAKMELVCTKAPSITVKKRAQEMGINIKIV